MGSFRKTGVVGTRFVGLDTSLLRQVVPVGYVDGEAGRGRLRRGPSCRKR